MKNAVKIILFLSIISCNNRLSNLEFDSNVIKMDSINLNFTVNKWLKFKNSGNKGIKINDIKTSCGCTIVKMSKPFIPSNSIDSILIQFTSSHKGRIEESIVINSNTEKKFDVIRIKGFVL